MLREIYRFRAGVEPYDGTDSSSLESFASSLTRIDERAGGRTTEYQRDDAFSNSAWPPPQLLKRVPVADNLVGELRGDVYDSARVLDQLRHYRSRSHRFAIEGNSLAGALLVVGAAGAFLLAISWKWKPPGAYAAVAAGIAAALVSWIAYRQRDAAAETMLKTSIDVRAARARWLARPESERDRSESVRVLVSEVESALAMEGSDWERTLRQAHGDFLARHRK